MLTLPIEFSEIISAFSSYFSKKVFEHAGQLMLGAILTQGKRTVCGVLRTLGLKAETRWHKYHRVLNRSKWSAYRCAHSLLLLLIKHFTPAKTLVFGIDETMERRWGLRIKARGIYRDAVRSSKSHFVKCSGLRWMCLMLLTPVGWANKIWALPFLTVLVPSERHHKDKGKRHKKLTDWARQLALQLRRWLPDFQIVIVADNSYAAIELLAATCLHVDWVTRFRMDAALYGPVPERPEGRVGRNRLKGERLPSPAQYAEDPATQWQRVCFSKWYNEENKEMDIASGTALWYHTGKPVVPLRWVVIRDPERKLDPIALQCTNKNMTPAEIVEHFVKRWQVEVTFEEVRAHLGVETQRQWSDLAIARTTPVLMALFSLVTLWANQLNKKQKLTVFQTAWYVKPYPTFSDAVASVRYRIWQFQYFSMSSQNGDMEKLKQLLTEHIAFMAARAA
ncbi:MAG: transposase [Saprospiraceae bacterium]